MPSEVMWMRANADQRPVVYLMRVDLMIEIPFEGGLAVVGV